MTSIPSDYLHKVYAGVLGKLIGVYLGRPFENWTHQQIIKKLGPIHYYTHEQFNLPCVVIDDDVSGTFTFVRALEEHGFNVLTSEEIGKTWLNNVIERRSVFWWGGNGISTEHTAYNNLKHKSISAPASGSIETNGKTIAEQIGAQIFIDGWALVAPGNPTLASQLAEAAAKVSHDGEAVHAAKLWAAMEAQAFISMNGDELLDIGLSFVPAESQIAILVNKIRAWSKVEPDWLVTRQQIENEYGYDKYEGICHVMPNHGIMILALLYGGHDFSTAMHIINTCGWDTDCNSGNVGCLLAIMHGLNAFEGHQDWRGPINDLALISSADDGYGINNAARLAYDIASSGYKLAGCDPPYKSPSAQYHFDLPGSVQGFQVNPTAVGNASIRQEAQDLERTGLSVHIRDPEALSEPVYISTPTFTPVEVLKVSRNYDMMASPLIYPGQTLCAQISASESNTSSATIRFRLKAYDSNNNLIVLDSDSNLVLSTGNEPSELSWTIPPELSNKPIQQVGLIIATKSATTIILHELGWTGSPRMKLHRPTLEEQAGVESSNEAVSMWEHSFVSSVDKFHTSLGPSFYLSQDHGEGMISHGTREWKDYRVVVRDFTVHLGQSAGVIVRVNGLRRWYALMFLPGGKVGIVKARDEVREVLAEGDFDWGLDKKYHVEVVVKDNEIIGAIGEVTISARDEDYGSGGIGLLLTEGAVSADSIEIEPA